MSFTDNQDATVYIVDDDPAARRSVVALVESRGTLAKEFSSAEEFLESADGQMYGCLVLDVRMGGMSGLDLQQRLLERKIPLPVIVITGYGDIPMAVRAMKAGAVSLLTKPCEADKLWENIATALAKCEADRKKRRRHEALANRLNTLTHDERAVLGKVMEGLPNKKIARQLDIGLRTVELRRSTVMKKMAVGSLAELVQAAVLAGFPNDNAT
jgi:FixJ family two-component response regulator